ncbi:MAG: helix-turn-helix transcriptional regulator [Oscillospiraceae bacterium]
MDQIKDLRKERGLSVRALGAMVGVSGASVTRWELGQAFPRSDKLSLLADALGCSIDDLFGRVNNSSVADAAS